MTQAITVTRYNLVVEFTTERGRIVRMWLDAVYDPEWAARLAAEYNTRTEPNEKVVIEAEVLS